MLEESELRAMVLIAALFGLILLAGGGFYFFSSGNGSQSNTRELLSDLGLTRKWSGEATTPFYRWGWTKTSTDRVWGERIVIKAFQKAGVWLRAEDMVYFKARCEDFAAKRSINDDAIISRVNEIVERNDSILELLTSQLKAVVEENQNLSLSDANQKLKEISVPDEKGNPQARLCVIALRRFLKNAGKLIMHPESKGFEFKLSGTEDVFHLKGVEAWRAFLALFKKSLDSVLKRGGVISNEAIREAVQVKVVHKLVKLYESDLLNQETYLQTVEQQIENGELEMDLESVKKAEALLFGWQFDESNGFNETHHQRFRSFITRRDLAPVFRHMVLKGIKTSIRSVNTLVQSFPRNIIFIGEDQKARAFAIKFYQYHLQRLFEVFSDVLDDTLKTPSPVLIPLEQIKKARTAKYHENERSKIAARRGGSASREEESDDTERYMTALIEKHKGYAAFERKLDQTIAERAGFLINIPLSEKDLLPDENRELQSGYLSVFSTFDCDVAGSIDFTSNSSKAKQERNEFFKLLLQRLHGRSGSLSAGADSEAMLDALESNQPPSLVPA